MRRVAAIDCGTNSIRLLIADLVETSVLDNQLLMPRFVLSELQGIADSSDKLRRARGRRGLDILNRLRSNQNVDFKIYDRELP